MKRLALTAVCGVMAASVLLITGCDDWSSGGDSSWTDRYSWMNFSGHYRGEAGVPLVTDYTAIRDADSMQASITQSFETPSPDSQEQTFSLARENVQPGSVRVVRTPPGVTLSDDGSGTLTGSGGAGTVDYGSGIVNLTLDNPEPAGSTFSISYSYSVAAEGRPPPGSGATKVRIDTFSIEHTGNRISIVDNNGAVYTGNLGRTTSSGGKEGPGGFTDQQPGGGNDEPGSPVTGGILIAQFTATGISASGMRINMTGHLQGNWSGGEITNRRILGTWIEKDGRVGDINGVAQTGALN